MAARDRWTVSLACVACETTGEARVSEDDYPFMKQLDFRVDSIDPGFVVKRAGDSSTLTEYACATCGGAAK